MQCLAQTIAEVQAEAAQARSSTVVALVARAERLHALRTSATSAALDWLRGELPADEVCACSCMTTAGRLSRLAFESACKL